MTQQVWQLGEVHRRALTGSMVQFRVGRFDEETNGQPSCEI
jgi:hypothetical protein